MEGGREGEGRRGEERKGGSGGNMQLNKKTTLNKYINAGGDWKVWTI